MRHSAYALGRVLCCLLAAGALASCGGDDNDNGSGSQPTFTALPWSNDMFLACGVNGMSDDGRVLVGTCDSDQNEFEAVVWVDGKLTDLGHMGPPPGELTQNSYAYRISNGGVVLGNEGIADLLPNVYYYDNGSWTGIVNPTTTFPAMEATGISADGQVIVGNTRDTIDNQGVEETFNGGFSWNRTTGDYVLATSSFFWDKCDSYENCSIIFLSITSDGKAVVGYDTYSDSGVSLDDLTCSDSGTSIGLCDHALQGLVGASGEADQVPIYYELKGTVPPVRLPLPDSYTVGVAKGVARNGSFIVGQATGSLMPTIAVYWDPNRAVHSIGSLGPDTEYNDTMAYDVSDDGSIIVGRSNAQAFLFTPAEGLMSLEDYLKSFGIEEPLADWELRVASAVSADGHTIAGTGIWRVHYLGAFVVKIP